MCAKLLVYLGANDMTDEVFGPEDTQLRWNYIRLFSIVSSGETDCPGIVVDINSLVRETLQGQRNPSSFLKIWS